MSLSQGVVLFGLACLMFELVRGKISPAKLFVGLAFIFVLLGYISVEKSLLQLINPGLVTIVVLVMVSEVLNRSHLLDRLVTYLARGSYRWTLIKIYVTTSAFSAFLNNTAVVATLMGPLTQNRTHSARRLLIPMCFAASLGGVLTLIGTSTNLLVNGLLVARGMASLQVFDLFGVGLMIVLACGAVMVMLYPRVLKDLDTSGEAPPSYFLEAVLVKDSKLVGNSVQSVGLRNLTHLYLAEIIRESKVIAPAAPDELLQAGDVLVFTGDVTRMDLLTRFHGLHTHCQYYSLPSGNLIEVIVAAESPLARRTLKETNFRSRLDAAVVAIRRKGERMRGPIGDIPLEVGDALMLVAGNDFDTRNEAHGDLVVISRQRSPSAAHVRKGMFALAAFAVLLTLNAFGAVDFLKGLLVLLAAYLFLGLADEGDLKHSIPFEIIAIFAASLVISDVLATSGAAGLITQVLLPDAVQVHPHFVLLLVLLATWVLTELMSNNAAAALMFPFALSLAVRADVSPTPLVMAVLYGASCSFVTPYGYQTNLMVMSPGKYTMGDYLRLGLPIAVVFQAVALMVIPLYFPFRS